MTFQPGDLVRGPSQFVGGDFTARVTSIRDDGLLRVVPVEIHTPSSNGRAPDQRRIDLGREYTFDPGNTVLIDRVTRARVAVGDRITRTTSGNNTYEGIVTEVRDDRILYTDDDGEDRSFRINRDGSCSPGSSYAVIPAPYVPAVGDIIRGTPNGFPGADFTAKVITAPRPARNFEAETLVVHSPVSDVDLGDRTNRVGQEWFWGETPVTPVTLVPAARESLAVGQWVRGVHVEPSLRPVREGVIDHIEDGVVTVGGHRCDRNARTWFTLPSYEVPAITVGTYVRGGVEVYGTRPSGDLTLRVTEVGDQGRYDLTAVPVVIHTPTDGGQEEDNRRLRTADTYFLRSSDVRVVDAPVIEQVEAPDTSTDSWTPISSVLDLRVNDKIQVTVTGGQPYFTTVLGLDSDGDVRVSRVGGCSDYISRDRINSGRVTITRAPGRRFSTLAEAQAAVHRFVQEQSSLNSGEQCISGSNAFLRDIGLPNVTSLPGAQPSDVDAWFQTVQEAVVRHRTSMGPTKADEYLAEWGLTPAPSPQVTYTATFTIPSSSTLTPEEMAERFQRVVRDASNIQVISAE